MAAMGGLIDLSEGVTKDTARATRLMQFSLRAFAPDEALNRELETYLDQPDTLARRTLLVVRVGDIFSMLMAGVIATENGNPAVPVGAPSRWPGNRLSTPASRPEQRRGHAGGVLADERGQAQTSLLGASRRRMTATSCT